MMRLALVKRKQITDPYEERVWVPDLPASLNRRHGWGQASDRWESRGKVLVWVRGTGAEFQAIVDGGGKLHGEISDTEAGRMVVALRTQAPMWPEYNEARLEMLRLAKENAGRTSGLSFDRLRVQVVVFDGLSRRVQAHDKPARDEFTVAYREIAEPLERTLIAGDIGRTIGTILLALGFTAGMTLIAKMFGPEGVSIAATIATDTFNRSNRSLDGDTMSDGSSTWALGNAPGWSIVSNQAQVDSGQGIEYCDSMANLADVRVSIDTKRSVSTSPSALGRYADVGNFYMARWSGPTTATQLYKRVASIWTRLAPDGSDISDLDTVTLQDVGTSHTVEINGSVDLGPVTDGTHSTGKAAIRDPSNTGVVDNFLAESVGATGARTSVVVTG